MRFSDAPLPHYDSLARTPSAPLKPTSMTLAVALAALCAAAVGVAMWPQGLHEPLTAQYLAQVAPQTAATRVRPTAVPALPHARRASTDAAGALPAPLSPVAGAVPEALSWAPQTHNPQSALLGGPVVVLGVCVAACATALGMWYWGLRKASPVPPNASTWAMASTVEEMAEADPRLAQALAKAKGMVSKAIAVCQSLCAPPPPPTHTAGPAPACLPCRIRAGPALSTCVCAEMWTSGREGWACSWSSDAHQDVRVACNGRLFPI